MAIIDKDQIQKHSEFTYGVHPLYVLKYLGDNFCSLEMGEDEVIEKLKLLETGVMGARRSIIKAHNLLRQGIVYALIFKHTQGPNGESDVLFGVYERNAKNRQGNNESDLAMMLSLGSGGHIEQLDVNEHVVSENGTIYGSGIIDLFETANNSLTREFEEEIKFQKNNLVHLPLNEIDPQYVGFVLDTKPDVEGYVGNIHFGIVAAIEVDPVVTFEMAEENNEAKGWMSVEDLQDYKKTFGENSQFEPWSEMIIAELPKLKHRILSGEV